jgi:hypothetical protein
MAGHLVSCSLSPQRLDSTHRAPRGLGSLGIGLAVVIRRELKETVPSERQSGAGREALSQLAEAVGQIHPIGPRPGPNPGWKRGAAKGLRRSTMGENPLSIFITPQFGRASHR